ncbi:hypothetical protein Csa_014574, partial [Cucumis sativus]
FLHLNIISCCRFTEYLRLGFEAKVRGWDFTGIAVGIRGRRLLEFAARLFLHGRRSPAEVFKAGGCLRRRRVYSSQNIGRRLLEFAARLFLHGRRSSAGELLHGEMLSSRQEAAARCREVSSRQKAAARTEGRSGAWRSWSVFTAEGCGREIDRGEIWRSRKRLHGRASRQGVRGSVFTAGLHGKVFAEVSSRQGFTA